MHGCRKTGLNPAILEKKKKKIPLKHYFKNHGGANTQEGVSVHGPYEDTSEAARHAHHRRETGRWNG